MAERLCLVSGRFRVQNSSRLNFRQRNKRFVTVSTISKVAVLPWRYDAEMGTAN